ncbi:MAG: Tm-1-like ATP-binding domain-containing protein [Candidatus Jordarchaeaceae archaeon]
MAKKIVIVATLDTRGDEVQYLKEIIEKKGHRAIIVDAGVMGKPQIRGDFPREKVAEAGGKSLKELVEAAEKGADRFEATKVMIEGVKKIVADLYSKGELDGIMSLGGTTAAALGTAAMKVLPIGVPKLLVTTFIDPRPIGDEDITVMQTPVDLVGLDKIVKKTLTNAAGAIIGMVEQKVPKAEEKPLVGMTVLGVTTPCVQKIMSRLQKRGYNAVTFHAKTTMLDRLIREGNIDAIIDVTSFETIPMVLYPPEYISMLIGAPEVRRVRLESANEKALPQIIAPGGLDMHIFPGTGIDQVPSEFKGRKWTMHGPSVVLVRTTREELEKVGKNIAERANRAKGPVAIIIPLHGFSEASKKGAPLHDPEADQGFIKSLKENVEKKVKVVEVDCHINDDLFADKVVETFEELIKGRR